MRTLEAFAKPKVDEELPLLGSVRHKHWFVEAHGKAWRNVHALRSRGKQNHLPFFLLGFLLGKMMVKLNG